jgi:hypothetical protein
MISCLRRLSLVACAATLGLSLAPAAQAVPLIGIEGSAAAFLDYTLEGNSARVPAGSMGLTLEASGAAFGLLDLSGRYMSNFATQANLAEVVLRKEFSPLPMISFKPGIGYQGQNVFSTGWDHAPIGKVQVAVSPILSPIWFEGEANVSYPLALGRPVLGTMVGGYLSILPMVNIGVRYLGYRDLNVQTAPVDFGGLQIGLRATI